MPPHLLSLLKNLAALAAIIATIALVLQYPPEDSPPHTPTEATTTVQTAAATVPLEATSTPPAHKAVAKPPTAPAPVPTPAQQEAPIQQPLNQVERVTNPYPFPVLPVSDVNTAVRAALVNILCMPRGGSLSPVSGSGVLIDSRGVILTNAHVAQYVLLSEDPRVNLSCTVRTGGPATAQWVPSVLYIPQVWVDQHVSEILTPHPIGTGEHDYALLLITGSATSAPLPTSFPFLPSDTREAIGFQGDQVLVASYPAEFVGGIAAQYNLFAASSLATIGDLLTFDVRSVDALSLGGVIEAQSGSSGGAVVNGWGRLIGLIATTSQAPTTAGRDLHALTLSYINRDLAAQAQLDLAGILDGDLMAEVRDFQANTAPGLMAKYFKILSRPH